FDHFSISLRLLLTFLATRLSDRCGPKLKYIAKAANALSLSFGCCSNASATTILSVHQALHPPPSVLSVPLLTARGKDHPTLRRVVPSLCLSCGLVSLYLKGCETVRLLMTFAPLCASKDLHAKQLDQPQPIFAGTWPL